MVAGRSGRLNGGVLDRPISAFVPGPGSNSPESEPASSLEPAFPPPTRHGVPLHHVSRLIVPALVCGVAAASPSQDFEGLRQEIAAARQSLVTMILHRDLRGVDQQMQVKATADAVSATLAKLQPPAGKEAEFKELKSTWDAFKKTREKDLVPAILRHDRATYEKIGAGIQKERLDRMYALIAILGR